MRTVHDKKGPFTEKPFFSDREIENTCTSELRAAGLYPTKPEPVRIDRFIEKRFKISHQYESLPSGVLGFTQFGSRGVEAIIVSKILEEAGGLANQRRVRSTLAHEGGHGLFHTYLFALGEKPTFLFDEEDKAPKILCRDVIDTESVQRRYDGRWWEFQANKAIGSLLMPRRLVEQVLEGFTTVEGSFGHRVLTAGKQDAVVRL